MSDQSFALQILKEQQSERYSACLYLPKNVRNDVAALWAFDAEISKIPFLVSEPMPGEIRLQWWRDLLKSGDNADAGPLAAELMHAIEGHNLPREALHTYLDAKIFDLYNDTMPDMGSLEGYLGETVSIFFQCSAICLGAETSREFADACGHAGMALGLARLLSNCAIHRSREQVFFPEDLLEKHFFNRERWLSSEANECHERLIAEIISTARYHLTFARAVIETLESDIRLAFLPLASAELILAQAEKDINRVLVQPIHVSQLRHQWNLLKAAIRKSP